MNKQRLSPEISAALGSGATVLVSSSQRQAAVRAAWAEARRAAGESLWSTPAVFTFSQFAEKRLLEQWAAANHPDCLLPMGAEWALLRELRDGGGVAEARALLAAVRLLHEWRIPRSAAALSGSPEGDRLLDALKLLDTQSRRLGRKPLRGWLDDLTPGGELCCAGLQGLPPLARDTLRRLGARDVESGTASAAVSIAAARDDHHELDLGEALRQHLVLALPMRADCGDACQGPNALLPADEPATEERENPFAALAALLDDE